MIMAMKEGDVWLYPHHHAVAETFASLLRLSCKDAAGIANHRC